MLGLSSAATLVTNTTGHGYKAVEGFFVIFKPEVT